MLDLNKLSDTHAKEAAAIAKITGDVIIKRHFLYVDIINPEQERELRIYFSGSNTRVMHKGFEVMEYCYDILHYLQQVGYRWEIPAQKHTSNAN